ncbi:MAG: threonine-phosphate decarboxylase [Thermodesulforhabdaceae bacterium]
MMKQSVHGGNIYEVARILRCQPEEIIDLSASINPLGPPAGLKDLICESFNAIRHYPDIGNTELIEAISDSQDINPDYVIVGNGSTEILYWIPYAFDLKRVAIVVPTFSEYIRSLENKGAIIRTLTASWEHGFQPTVYQLEALINNVNPDAIFLTNPGSPSGVPFSDDIREFIKEKAKRSDFLWIIDEVFIDFCEEFSLLELVKALPNILIIRSLTKFYALPGLRLGYALAHPLTCQRLRNFIPPWSVNTIAQIAGAYCIKQDDFRMKTLEFFSKERARVFGVLREFPWLSFLKTFANYVLIKLNDNCPTDAAKIQTALIEQKRILIRNCENFKGLSNRFIRIAIASPELNDLWLQALKELIAGLVSNDSNQVKEVSGRQV